MVRMAEQAVSRNREDTLVSLGLGSCIGLALFDRRRGGRRARRTSCCPESHARGGGDPGEVRRHRRAAPASRRSSSSAPTARACKAVLCGGAHMFARRARQLRCCRSATATRRATLAALKRAASPCAPRTSAASSGRSVEVRVGDGRGAGPQRRQPPRKPVGSSMSPGHPLAGRDRRAAGAVAQEPSGGADGWTRPHSAQKVQNVDFRRQSKFNRDQLRTLEMLHETFSRLGGTYLSGALRSVAEISVLSAEQVTYGEFISSLPVPGTDRHPRPRAPRDQRHPAPSTCRSCSR